ncbi:urate hydroxylase PuuD [Cocleimonas flava]|uniref:Putative membrane protein n=1 Tax=Cocleimonas flava TaxID=634765 RepID=A0A4R1F9F3_9GAMM|nr:urate hydroxylase PuuD [Cocleimonas flava]TCJ87401.1 putative membrane protein [Cocleimonas flava]
MEAHIAEWLNLLVRWIHFIVGVAWIGASFYFNWLENHLNRQALQEKGIDGNLWAVHGGGFYHLKKFENGPDKLPEVLHWFKWEAYMTWVSGITLMCIVYYYNAQAMMIDPSVLDISPFLSILIGIGSLVVSWVIYDQLCKSSLKENPKLLGALIFVFLGVLAFILSLILSPRASYIHVGAAIGTIMAANVFFVIIPSQKELVKALSEGRIPDPSFGANGLLRSRHNNYLTLPVLFIMISNHFPSTYGNQYNWLVLITVSAVGVLVRHYYNIRHLHKAVWMLPTALFGFIMIVMATMPAKQAAVEDANKVTTAQIMPIITQRCASCHSAKPTQPGFAAPPAGLAYDKPIDVENNADKVNTQVMQKIMPLGNLTQMTDEEREKVSLWYRSLEK